MNLSNGFYYLRVVLMKKHILIACALPVELKTAKKIIKDLNFKEFKVSFLLTGVWVYNTIYAIKDYMSKNHIDFLVNFWVCWKKELSSDDFFQVYRIKKLSDYKEYLPPIYIEKNNLESIACSDKIITSEEELVGEKYVDMESFWIDFICEKEKVPFVIIKKPFDIVSFNSKKVSLSDIESSLSSYDFLWLFNDINTFLKENEKLDLDFEFVSVKDSMTFQEFEKFKTNINKRLAFWESLEDIKKSLDN